MDPGLAPTLTQACLSALRHYQAISSPDLKAVPDILIHSGPSLPSRIKGAFILHSEPQDAPDFRSILLNLTFKMLLGSRKEQRI